MIDTEIGSRTPEFQIRGYSLYDLSEHATLTDLNSLLFYGELSTPEIAADLQSRIQELSNVDPSILERVAALPFHVSIHEALRFSLLELSQFDEQRDNPHAEATIDHCLKLQKQLLQLMAIRYCSSQGVPMPAAPANLDLIDQFLLTFRGVPAEPLERQVVNTILILFATAPECPSDMAARAVASVSGDFGPALVAAISASTIPHITRDAEAVFQFLDEIDCEADVEEMLDQIRAGELEPPAMCAPTDDTDPREEILRVHCLTLADDREQAGFEALVDRIERVCPNRQTSVAWPLARLFHYLGLEHELIAPLLTVARMPAWTAHYLEQFGHPLTCEWHYNGPESRSIVETDDFPE
ncbi:MAG: citrate/2-methylcitrate synthase [Planctomycetaceae bacterium]|nr:citrate/2-methylcitrate synthase [Planctomycetaceae bacterium]